MARFVGTRLILLIPVLLLVSLATFFLVDLVPGDPAVTVLGPNAAPQDYARVRAEMKLDEPAWQRYGDRLSHAVRGDLGKNLVPPVEDVSARLSRALPVNLELALLALGMALAVSIPLAVYSANRPGSRFDRMVTASMFGLISVPTFLAGIILLLVFAIHWQIFPTSQWARPTQDGWGANLSHAFLPALTLALSEIAVFTRLLRSDMISTLREDYILAARAKGTSTRHVLWREALRPSSFSLVTLAGISFGRLIGGTVIVEAVFVLPGLGRTMVDAAKTGDFPLVQGGVILIASIYIALTVAVELLYHFLDPRVRRSHV